MAEDKKTEKKEEMINTVKIVETEKIEKEMETVEASAETVEKKKEWAPSRFQTLNTLHDTRESLKKSVFDYNEKLIKKPVDAGRQFVKELQNDPLKKIDGVIEESTKAVKTFKDDSRKRMDEVKTKSKEISAKLKKSPSKYVGEMVSDVKRDTEKSFSKYSEDRKKFVDAVEKDLTLIRDDVVDAGKKALDKLPMKKSIEKKMNTTFEKFPSMLNLPSKKELEALIKEVDTVSRKVDSLSKQTAAA